MPETENNALGRMGELRAQLERCDALYAQIVAELAQLVQDAERLIKQLAGGRENPGESENEVDPRSFETAVLNELTGRERTIAQVAEATGHSTSHVRTMVKKLEQDGLVRQGVGLSKGPYGKPAARWTRS